VVGLIEAAGRERAAVIGHDWGAAAAWWTAGRYPERVARLGILNAPHGSVMAKRLRSSLSQLRKSWYMLFFQIPRLPELILRRGNWGAIVRALQGTSRPGTFREADITHYREAWSQPGAMRAMINWYRAASRRVPTMGYRAKITVPTLVIWGARDHFMDREMAQSSIERCEDGRLVMIAEASHWVQHEEAERVNGLLLEFLGEMK
jgi:pimeloyl-ACP methyl ester carboxylesterase